MRSPIKLSEIVRHLPKKRRDWKVGDVNSTILETDYARATNRSDSPLSRRNAVLRNPADFNHVRYSRAV